MALELTLGIILMVLAAVVAVLVLMQQSGKRGVLESLAHILCVSGSIVLVLPYGNGCPCPEKVS